MEGNASMEHSHDGEHALEALEPDKPVQQGGSHDAEGYVQHALVFNFPITKPQLFVCFLNKKEVSASNKQAHTNLK